MIPNIEKLREHVRAVRDHEAAYSRERETMYAPLAAAYGVQHYRPICNDAVPPGPVGQHWEPNRFTPKEDEEIRNQCNAAAERLAEWERGHRPDVNPWDTPAKLGAWIDTQLDRGPDIGGRAMLHIKDRQDATNRAYRAHADAFEARHGYRQYPTPGSPGIIEVRPATEERLRRAYRTARGRALAFVPLVPCVADRVPHRDDPYQGLLDIRAWCDVADAEIAEGCPPVAAWGGRGEWKHKREPDAARRNAERVERIGVWCEAEYADVPGVDPRPSPMRGLAGEYAAAADPLKFLGDLLFNVVEGVRCGTEADFWNRQHPEMPEASAASILAEIEFASDALGRLDDSRLSHPSAAGVAVELLGVLSRAKREVSNIEDSIMADGIRRVGRASDLTPYFWADAYGKAYREFGDKLATLAHRLAGAASLPAAGDSVRDTKPNDGKPSRITLNPAKTVVTLDGDHHAIDDPDAGLLLDALIKASGERRSYRELLPGVGNVSRLKKKLPPAVLKHIEAQPSTGVRLTLWDASRR